MTPTEIRAAREVLRLTQAQIAPLLGYGSQSRIAEIEGGKKGVGASVIRLLQAYVDGYRPKDWPVPMDTPKLTD